MADEAFLQRTYEARDRFVRTLGQVDPDVLAPAVNPAFMGGPMWPNLRQAWRVVRRGTHTLIVSDGLSDPFSDEPEPNVGFGIEVLVETSDPLPGPPQTSWLFSVAYDMAQQCADDGGFRDRLDRHGLLSFELPASEGLEPLATPDGFIGVLLGLAAPELQTAFELPAGTVKLMTAKLLWPSELEHVIAHGRQGREELAARFASDGTFHRSSSGRKPAV